MIRLIIYIIADRQDGMLVYSHPVKKEMMFANEDEEKIVGLVWENVKTAFDVLDKKMEARSHSEEPFNIDDI
jgi:hypothetical protein